MKLVDLETRIDVKVTAGVLDQDVRSVTQDSRDVEKGSLFVALPGSEVDGHEFIGQALERGANALLVENLPGWVVENGVGLKVGVLVVPDTRKALAIASSFFNGEPSKSLSVTGITGTNGKTTVSYLVDGIFLAAGFSVGVLGTIENRLGKEVKDSNLTTPDASEIQKLFKNMVERRISHCVMEVSSHALEQDRTWGTRFKSCVFTNLTHDHLDYHKSMKSYLHAKEQLFTAYKPECSIVNIDDPAGASIARKVSGKLLTYGLQGKADLTCDVL
ncbi:MAG: Mur ligase family protein, partial [Nitrospinota bacterium]